MIEVNESNNRLNMESKLISTISWCEDCFASQDWLGNSSPKSKIVQSGLWQVNELYKKPFGEDKILEWEHFGEGVKA